MPRRPGRPPQRNTEYVSGKSQDKSRPAADSPPSPRRSSRRSASASRCSENGSSDTGSVSSERPSRQTRSRSEIRMTPALRQIVRLQMSTQLLIPRLPFARVIREVLQEYSGHQLRVTPDALCCLQEASEIYLTQLFADATRCMLHRDRATLLPKDLQLALFLRHNL